MGEARNEPTFVGIGGQKCGSSSVANYLRLLGARIPNKELHYFQRSNVSRREYLSLFPRSKPRIPTGEFTPDYLYSTKAIDGLSRFLSESRFVVVLRDPVQRFYSAANHGRGIGRIPKSWSASRILSSTLRGSNDEHWHRSLIWKGFFGEHLAKAMRFLPRARMEVFFLEELIDIEKGRGPRQALVDFVGLQRRGEDISFPRANSARRHLGLSRKLPEDPHVNEFLRSFYAPSITRLSDILEREVPWDS